MTYRISSMYSHTRKTIMRLLSAFAIQFLVLTASKFASIRLGKRKPPPIIRTILSLVEVFAFQAIVARPGANICPRRKLPLMFVIWMGVFLDLPC